MDHRPIPPQGKAVGNASHGPGILDRHLLLTEQRCDTSNRCYKGCGCQIQGTSPPREKLRQYRTNNLVFKCEREFLGLVFVSAGLAGMSRPAYLGLNELFLPGRRHTPNIALLRLNRHETVFDCSRIHDEG